MTTAAQGMQFFNFLRGQRAASEKDSRDLAFKRLDVESKAIDSNISIMHKSIKESTGVRREHNMNVHDTYISGLNPYQRKRLAPLLNVSVAGPKQRALWAFDEANPPEPRPGVKYIDKVVETEGEGGVKKFTNEKVPTGKEAGLYELGDWALRETRKKRQRLQLQTGVVDNRPIRIPMGNGIIMAETAEGSAKYLTEEDLNINDIAGKYGKTPGELRAELQSNNYSFSTGTSEVYNYNTNKTEIVDHRLDVVDSKHGLSVVPTENKPRRPANTGDTLKNTSVFNSFEHLPRPEQDQIRWLELNFHRAVQDINSIKDDTSEGAQLMRNIVYMLNPKADPGGANVGKLLDTTVKAGKNLKEIEDYLNTKIEGATFKLVDKPTYDTFSMFNPLDWIDPEHWANIYESASKGDLSYTYQSSAKYKKPAQMGFNVFRMAHDWGGGVYVMGANNDFDIRIAPRGQMENLAPPGAPPAVYNVVSPGQGKSQTYNEDTQMLGTREFVQQVHANPAMRKIFMGEE